MWLSTLLCRACIKDLRSFFNMVSLILRIFLSVCSRNTAAKSGYGHEKRRMRWKRQKRNPMLSLQGKSKGTFKGNFKGMSDWNCKKVCVSFTVCFQSTKKIYLVFDSLACPQGTFPPYTMNVYFSCQQRNRFHTQSPNPLLFYRIAPHMNTQCSMLV